MPVMLYRVPRRAPIGTVLGCGSSSTVRLRRVRILRAFVRKLALFIEDSRCIYVSATSSQKGIFPAVPICEERLIKQPLTYNKSIKRHSPSQLYARGTARERQRYWEMPVVWAPSFASLDGATPFAAAGRAFRNSRARSRWPSQLQLCPPYLNQDAR